MKILISFVFDLILAAYCGFILHILWGWFVVPMGVHSIGTFQSAGLCLIFNVLKGVGSANFRAQLDSKENPYTEFFLLPIEAFAATVSLGIGAVYHWMM